MIVNLFFAIRQVAIRDGDYELIEARQVYKSGAVKERNTILSEKFVSTETPVEAACRGISEELGDVLGDRPKVGFVSTSCQ